MSYEITGTVKVVGDAQTFGGGFTKRTLVITTDDEKYPQDVPVDFCQDKASLLDTLEVGQEVTAAFNIRGNEWNGKYFCSLSGWRLDAGVAREAPTSEAPAEFVDDDDDIPF